MLALELVDPLLHDFDVHQKLPSRFLVHDSTLARVVRVARGALRVVILTPYVLVVHRALSCPVIALLINGQMALVVILLCRAPPDWRSAPLSILTLFFLPERFALTLHHLRLIVLNGPDIIFLSIGCEVTRLIWNDGRLGYWIAYVPDFNRLFL